MMSWCLQGQTGEVAYTIQNPDFLEDWPPYDITWSSNSLLFECIEVKKDPDIDVEYLKELSSNFPIDFPIQTARCASLKCDAAVLTSNINSTYPIIDEHVLRIIEEFLAFKKRYGSSIEKTIYENMGITEFVDRLLKKRAVMFVGARDYYTLLNKATGSDGWDKVGTEEETSPLVLADCLSYAEMKISSLLSVSSYTQFINTGNRKNNGKPAEDLSVLQERGIIIGLIGTRLSRLNAVECEDIVIHKNQNTVENGYGLGEGEGTSLNLFRHMWSNFYDEPQFYLFKDASKLYKWQSTFKKATRFAKLSDFILFDNIYYKKRLSLSFDTLLLEANARAKEAKTTAYVHVVGIGLGVWRVSNHQDQMFLDIFAQRIKALFPSLHNVSDIIFGYFKTETCGGFKNNELIVNNDHPMGGIKIQFTSKDPHTKLVDVDKDKLLVVSYAWDGNSLPGNEYWSGSLNTSSDPAAACSTQVAELHNAHVNSANVSGKNLHVASRRYGVLHISDYATKFAKQ